MPVTMETGITQVRALLDETTALYWTDAQIQGWINQGAEDVARRAEILWEEVSIAVTPNVQNYSFPEDFLNAHRAEFTISGVTGPGAQTFNLDYRGINQMDEVWGILHSLPAAWPQYFTIRGNSAMGFFLMMYPSPAAAGTLVVYYYRTAVYAQETTDFIDTQEGWTSIIFDYAVAKAFRKAKRPEWQEAMQIYERNLQNLIDKSRNKTDLGEQVTTGMPSWPIYAYSEGADNW
jgi:hypothetical protein